ncbi:hypothetical protein F7734_35280 [Scytonema sp. UIC 10036]|nr:hypothetical protein [Scytonema sp. UIC 10036]MUG97311.1 hypothetical protein [Scytonema sp. UIC 10036]
MTNWLNQDKVFTDTPKDIKKVVPEFIRKSQLVNCINICGSWWSRWEVVG